MTKFLWTGGWVVNAAAGLLSWPAISEFYCWEILGLLSVLPFAYGVAATMLTTLLQNAQ